MSPYGVIAFVYLLTHPNMTNIGAMRANVEGLCRELPMMDPKGFAKGFAEAFRKGFAKYDPEAQLVALPNFVRYNPPENPNVVRGWARALDLLPECDLLSAHIAGLYEHVQTLSKGFREGFEEAFREPLAKGLAKQEQEQEQEQEKDSLARAGARGNAGNDESATDAETHTEPPLEETDDEIAEGFERFWNAYPRQVSKPQAQGAWFAMRKVRPPLDDLLASLARQKASTQWTSKGGQFIPNPANWLRNHGWADELPAAPKSVGLSDEVAEQFAEAGALMDGGS